MSSALAGEYAYAHPTVRNTHTLRGVRAACWMSDTMGCVAADERQCHSAEYLTHTLSTLLADSTDWHAVAYVCKARRALPVEQRRWWAELAHNGYLNWVFNGAPRAPPGTSQAYSIGNFPKLS